MTDLSVLTPAQIDQLWIEAVAPANRLREQASALYATGRKYAKAGGRYIEQGARYEQRGYELNQRAGEILAEVEPPFRAEWDSRGGWSRAYIVPDGHIHRSTACHTLHPTTIVGWLPEQSGLSEDEIVAAAGVHACTVCYPSAPVEALRAAEAAAKAESECSGSRSYDYDQATWRRTSYTGTGRAVCRGCGNHVGTTTSGKLRAHKKEASA